TRPFMAFSSSPAALAYSRVWRSAFSRPRWNFHAFAFRSLTSAFVASSLLSSLLMVWPPWTAKYRTPSVFGLIVPDGGGTVTRNARRGGPMEGTDRHHRRESPRPRRPNFSTRNR